jgi:hypothetical protein
MGELKSATAAAADSISKSPLNVSCCTKENKSFHGKVIFLFFLIMADCPRR